MVGGDEGLVDDHPAGVLGSLDQQVGQCRDRHIRLVGAVKQICKQLLVLWKESENVCMQEFKLPKRQLLVFYVNDQIATTRSILLAVLLLLTVKMFLLWSNYLLCSGLAHSLCKALKIMFSHSQLAGFLSKSRSRGTYQDISIHESDVYLACQTVPGCKDPIVDSLTCCRHPQPTKRL